MDVFLSYARQDRTNAESVAAALRAHGWSVWMDTALHAGDYWDETIERAMREARCVVVLWSGASVSSHFVRTEAEYARERGILVPARLEEVEAPYGFARLHTANLTGWEGSGTDPGLTELVAGVAKVIQGDSVPAPQAAVKRAFPMQRALVVVAILLPVFVVILLAAVRRTGTSITLQVTASGVTFTPERSQELSDLLVLEQLGASGFEELQVPRSKSNPGAILHKSAGIEILKLSQTQPLGRGSITLAPLVLPAGALTTIRAIERPFGFRVLVESGRVPVTVNVEGVVNTVVTGAPARTLDFGFPKPLIIDSEKRGVDLDLVLKGVVPNLLPAPIRVNTLSLVRLDERNQPGRGVVQQISTVLSGTLTIDAAEGSRRLTSGEKLLFEDTVGFIREVQLDSDRLSLNFQGKVRKLSSCAVDNCTDLTPSWAGFLWSRQRTLLLLTCTGYFVALLFAAVRAKQVL